MTRCRLERRLAQPQRPQTPLLHPRRSRVRLSDPEPALRRVLRARARRRASASRSAIMCSISGSSSRTAASRLASSACSRSPRSMPFMALGPKMWTKTRARISELLRHDHPELRDNEELRKQALVPMRDVKLHMPIAVSGYTDFYSSKEHATNVGVMFRGKDNALQPNWLHMPIGYNGRASTVVVSGTKVKRPRGQLKPPNAEVPSFGPVQAARLRAGDGRRGRPGVADGRDADRAAGRGDDLRLRDPQRLERARHPAMGICAARPVPGQGVRHLDQPVGGDARGAGAVPPARPGAGAGSRCLICARRSRTITIWSSMSPCAPRG